MSRRAAAMVGTAGLIAIASGVALADEPSVIEHIIVLAQKRESALQDVPLSVTALTGSQLAAAGLGNIAEISQRLPTLDQQRTSTLTTTTFRIRRIGNLAKIPTFESAVGLFVDGVALRLGMRLGSNYELVLWGENLLDEDVATIDAVLNLFNDASYQSFMAEPRSYWLALRVAF